MKDQEYMNIAIQLAKKGAGRVNPNPMVGAVLVKDKKIIGEGYHEYFGGPHAERNAISHCKESPKGATLYVTLEPCCHYGKTPPCTEAIIQSGISKVVIGTLDRNPEVMGKGVSLLKKHSIEVKTGVLEKECNQLIKVFDKYITTKRPFVRMKYAMTMDGKIATRTNQSKWISGKEARDKVHQIRNDFSAIMVGVNTVIQDDPLLTCRIKNGKNPVRIICDTHLRTPLTSQIVQTATDVKTYVATNCNDTQRIKPYEKKGCEIIQVGLKDNQIDLYELMERLGEKKIDSVLLEGGGSLNWSALEQKIVDEIHVFIAPKIFGGSAKTPVQGSGIDLPSDAIMLKPYSISKIGEDYLIESEVSYSCSQEL